MSIGRDTDPPLQLRDVSGRMLSLDDFEGKLTILNFWSAECEWCERVDRELLPYLEQWGQNVNTIWIASNENEGHAMIARVADERGIAPVALDVHHQAANRFGAQTTPHFFIFDGNGNLAYQGAWDDITFRQRVATQQYVPQVVEALLQGQPPPITRTQAYGCVLVRFAD